jgi:hypothetical protein
MYCSILKCGGKFFSQATQIKGNFKSFFAGGGERPIICLAQEKKITAHILRIRGTLVFSSPYTYFGPFQRIFLGGQDIFYPVFVLSAAIIFINRPCLTFSSAGLLKTCKLYNNVRVFIFINCPQNLTVRIILNRPEI